MEVRPAEALELGIQIAEQTALEKRIVAEVDSGRHIRRAVRDLLGLREKVVGPAVEHHSPDDPHRQHLLGDDLGRVEHIERLLVGELLIEELQAEFPLGEVAALDRLEEVAAVIVRVGTGDLDRLIPHRGVG